MDSARSKSQFWSGLLLLGAFGLLVGLGSWQLQRLGWKQGLIASIEVRGQAAPQALREVIAADLAGKDVAFTRVRLEGSFDHEREIHLYTVLDGKAGWRIVTPLITDAGLTVFVDRGFVPEGLKDPTLRPAGRVVGRQRLTGIVRLGETQTMFVPDNDLARNQWYWRDLAAMQSRLPAASKTVPFLIELAGAPPAGGFPLPSPISPNLPNRHLEYALTWFALAATLLGVAAVYIRAARQSRQTPDRDG